MLYLRIIMGIDFEIDFCDDVCSDRDHIVEVQNAKQLSFFIVNLGEIDIIFHFQMFVLGRTKWNTLLLCATDYYNT